MLFPKNVTASYGRGFEWIRRYSPFCRIPCGRHLFQDECIPQNVPDFSSKALQKSNQIFCFNFCFAPAWRTVQCTTLLQFLLFLQINILIIFYTSAFFFIRIFVRCFSPLIFLLFFRIVAFCMVLPLFRSKLFFFSSPAGSQLGRRKGSERSRQGGHEVLQVKADV